jgi:hypothetical protein
MIVVSIWRPDLATAETLEDVKKDPFDGMEVFGIYYDSTQKKVEEMVSKLADAHPDWRFNIDHAKMITNPEAQVAHA